MMIGKKPNKSAYCLCPNANIGALLRCYRCRWNISGESVTEPQHAAHSRRHKGHRPGNPHPDYPHRPITPGRDGTGQESTQTPQVIPCPPPRLRFPPFNSRRLSSKSSPLSTLRTRPPNHRRYRAPPANLKAPNIHSPEIVRGYTANRHGGVAASSVQFVNST